MTTKAELDRAYLAGVSAKQVGRPREANPYRHRKDRHGEVLADGWDNGWDDQYAHSRGMQAHGMD